MGVFPQIERFVWFEHLLRQRAYPNTTRLVEQFGISRKTAQRDISYLRDRLPAPIDYDRTHNRIPKKQAASVAEKIGILSDMGRRMSHLLWYK